MLRARGAISSVGRAPARQAGGHWFEPSIAHDGNPLTMRVSAFSESNARSRSKRPRAFKEVGGHAVRWGSRWGEKPTVRPAGVSSSPTSMLGARTGSRHDPLGDSEHSGLSSTGRMARVFFSRGIPRAVPSAVLESRGLGGSLPSALPGQGLGPWRLWCQARGRDDEPSIGRRRTRRLRDCGTGSVGRRVGTPKTAIRRCPCGSLMARRESEGAQPTSPGCFRR
jgi:hypothetical protein